MKEADWQAESSNPVRCDGIFRFKMRWYTEVYALRTALYPC